MFRLSPWLKGLIPLGLFVVLGVFLADGLRRDPSSLPSQMIDRPLPDFDKLTFTGEPIRCDDIIGDVALLNIFGSWCVACLQEHPLLMEVSKSQTINIIGVNWRDDKARAAQWLQRYGNPYSEIIVDPNSQLIIELGVVGAPETFLIDASGQIRYKHTGPISREAWDNIFGPLIQTLRDESASEEPKPSL